MPYIVKHRREAINEHGIHVVGNAGELNFFITTSVLEYLANTTERYKDYNEVIGVLELVKLELWHRLICPYEKKKREENGDVY